MPLWIYILECQDNCWFVGATSDPNNQYGNYFGSNESEWIKMHPPIRLYELIPKCNYADENRHIIRYMIEYGTDLVRGGSYSNPILSTKELMQIQTQIWSIQGLCLKCGNDHLFGGCPNVIEEPKRFGNESARSNILCARCGRTTHNTSSCNDKTNISGETLLQRSTTRPQLGRRRSETTSALPLPRASSMQILSDQRSPPTKRSPEQTSQYDLYAAVISEHSSVTKAEVLHGLNSDPE